MDCASYAPNLVPHVKIPPLALVVYLISIFYSTVNASDVDRWSRDALTAHPQHCVLIAMKAISWSREGVSQTVDSLQDGSWWSCWLLFCWLEPSEQVFTFCGEDVEVSWEETSQAKAVSLEPPTTKFLEDETIFLLSISEWSEYL